MCRRFFLIFAALLFFMMGSCAKKEPTYRIGIDPTWFPLRLAGKEVNVFAFSCDLLQEIANLKKIRLERVTIGWDHLISGLREGKYEGILSSLSPYSFNEAKYEFSSLYFPLGPILLVRGNSYVNSMNQMVGKKVGVGSTSDEAILVENYPDVIVYYYAALPVGLNDLMGDVIDGMLVNAVVGRSYARDLYRGKIKIASPPLSKEGLRLVTLKGKHQEFISLFNEALKELQEQGVYDKLLKKWGLD